METSVGDIVEFAASIASSLTVGGLLILIFYGGFKRLWVFGWVHEEAKSELLKQLAASKQEAAEWRAFAMKGTAFAERAAGLAGQPDGGG